MRYLILVFIIGKLYSQDTLLQYKTLRDTVATLDTTSTDSLFLNGLFLYVASKDSVDKPVIYSSRDSIIFELSKKLIHLYGNANIKYQTMELNADYIVIDMNNNEVEATPLLDSLKSPTGVPKFKDGDQSFDAQNIRYNFKTKKGVVKEVLSKEADIFIHGEKSKFISKDSEGSSDHTVYNEHGIFTTCDAGEPHFGIFSKRQKIIPNKLIIVGPSIVKIHNVPAPPFMLPFGFFPISKNKTSGLIFPRNYIFSPDYGFGLEGIGYYIPISDYMDLKVTTDFYFKGSFGLNTYMNYSKRYKYSGNASIEYDNFNRELSDSYITTKIRTLNLRLSHRQLSGAHPYRTVSGSIDFYLNPNSRLIQRDARSVLQNTAYSIFTMNYVLPNTPFSLNMGITHNLNFNTRIVNLTLPSLDVNMRPINPFKSKSKISQTEKWYEKITLNYNSKILNRVSTYDSALFNKNVLDTMQYGVRHNASIDINFKLLKYLNFVPSISYNEEWFFRNQEKIFDPDTQYVKNRFDTTKLDTLFGAINTITSNKFGALREISIGASIGTQIYGQILSNKGWFRGVRHVISPTINFGFSPNYHRSPFNYYSTVDSDSRPSENKKIEYLRFQNSPFGTSTVAQERAVITFNINNRVEGKYYSKRDSTSKKINLLDNLNLGCNYQPNADSFKLSNISGFGRIGLFKGLTSINFGFSLDPYARIKDGDFERRVDTLSYKSNGRIFYLNNSDIGLATQFTIPQLIRLISGKKATNEELPTFGSIFETFSIYHQLSYNFNRLRTGKDTFYQSVNTLSTNGVIPLTSKWKVTVGNIGYDIKNKSLTYPDFGFERDLHCWRMNFKYFPVNKAFQFFIGVNPGSLDFIKVPNNRNVVGGF
ncbi:MAG: LPS-assembly protein LptD [Saprospiraceae bacterium]|nr:LPS-assembly protein LptD [Saprospiraceae bacterium]